MRILLDHCTPRQVARALPGHQVNTAFQMGWHELENGDLLRIAEDTGFELLIVCDQNLRYQQNLSNRIIAILELWTNHRPRWNVISNASEPTLSRWLAASIAGWKIPSHKNKKECAVGLVRLPSPGQLLR